VFSLPSGGYGGERATTANSRLGVTSDATLRMSRANGSQAKLRGR
jgi:hypothetical protein